MVSRIIQVPSFDLVVFGATGDLAQRKIFPALYGRLLAGQMPSNAKVIGIARQDISTNKFRMLVRKSGTEPKIRIMCESENRTLLLKCINIVKKSIR